MSQNKAEERRELSVEDERASDALEQSIAHWQRVVDGSEIATGSDECDLCKEFYPENRKDFNHNTMRPNGCAGCPIDEHTQGNGCEGTPCIEYFEAMEEGHPEAAHDYAVSEVEFLKGLRRKTAS